MAFGEERKTVWGAEITAMHQFLDDATLGFIGDGKLRTLLPGGYRKLSL